MLRFIKDAESDQRC